MCLSRKDMASHWTSTRIFDETDAILDVRYSIVSTLIRPGRQHCNARLASKFNASF